MPKAHSLRQPERTTTGAHTVEECDRELERLATLAKHAKKSGTRRHAHRLADIWPDERNRATHAT